LDPAAGFSFTILRLPVPGDGGGDARQHAAALVRLK
jgi:hypothetical protein